MRHREPLRVLSLIYDHPWAITPNALNQILEIVHRPGADAVAAASRYGKPLDGGNGNAYKSNGVAVIDILGPIFSRSDMFAQISGATSAQSVGEDLDDSLEDEDVEAIVLNIDSPGGQVIGINELADAIRQANEQKPVTAYVYGNAASAAYWLASAAGQIVANESAFLGSIGVVAAIRDNREAMERQGVRTWQIVSSQSPRKAPDPATEAGRAQIQEQIDSYADLFVGRVAKFRGVTSDDVVNKFGAGKVLPARLAVAAGMADRIGPSFQALMAELKVPANPSLMVPSYYNRAQEDSMPPNANEPNAQPGAAAPNPQPAAAPASTERQRIAAIMRLPEAEGRRALAEHIAFNTDYDLESARGLLAAAPKENAAPAIQPAPPARSLAQAMADVPNPKVPVGTGGDAENDVQTEVAAILRHVPQHRLARGAAALVPQR